VDQRLHTKAEYGYPQEGSIDHPKDTLNIFPPRVIEFFNQLFEVILCKTWSGSAKAFIPVFSFIGTSFSSGFPALEITTSSPFAAFSTSAENFVFAS